MFLKSLTVFLFRYGEVWCFLLLLYTVSILFELTLFHIYFTQVREEDEEIEAEGANYQLEMMRCLREVNVDNNTVGW